MTDSMAAQREARRLKLMKNAENRMNRLRDKPQVESEDSTNSQFELKDIGSNKSYDDGNDIEPNNETITASPYNLRNRTRQGSSKPEVQKVAPYEIVEDPEVPSLAEFLATQEASKPTTAKNKQTFNSNVSYLPPKTIHGDVQVRKLEKHAEYIRVIGLIVTAVLSRWTMTYEIDFTVFVLGKVFQSMFFLFVLFEVSVTYAIHKHMPGVSSAPPQGSLLTTALMLSGIKAELVQLYIRIMARVTSISNDLFLYIFAFLVCHVVFG